jgi:hypothetical protein
LGTLPDQDRASTILSLKRSGSTPLTTTRLLSHIISTA